MMADTKRKDGPLEPQNWVDLYGDQLYRYAYTRVKNQMVAEDLVQETFLAALAGIDGFEGRSSEKTWLTAILKNKFSCVSSVPKQKNRCFLSGKPSAAFIQKI